MIRTGGGVRKRWGRVYFFLDPDFFMFSFFFIFLRDSLENKKVPSKYLSLENCFCCVPRTTQARVLVRFWEKSYRCLLYKEHKSYLCPGHEIFRNKIWINLRRISLFKIRVFMFQPPLIAPMICCWWRSAFLLWTVSQCLHPKPRAMPDQGSATNNQQCWHEIVTGNYNELRSLQDLQTVTCENWAKVRSASMGTWPKSSWTQSLKDKEKERNSVVTRVNPKLKSPTQTNLTEDRLLSQTGSSVWLDNRALVTAGGGNSVPSVEEEKWRQKFIFIHTANNVKKIEKRKRERKKVRLCFPEVS